MSGRSYGVFDTGVSIAVRGGRTLFEMEPAGERKDMLAQGGGRDAQRRGDRDNIR